MSSRTSMTSIWPPTAEIARAAGHERLSPLQAIRRKCIDCSYYQPNEVRLCEATGCPLWPFRAGQHPWVKATMSRGPGPKTGRFGNAPHDTET